MKLQIIQIKYKKDKVMVIYKQQNLKINLYKNKKNEKIHKKKNK